jgi:hypothetical protein
VTGHTHDVDDVHGLRDGLEAAQRQIRELQRDVAQMKRDLQPRRTGDQNAGAR